MSTKKQGFAAMPREKVVEISRHGGSKKHPKKGFGSLSKKTRRENASKASKARWEKVKQIRKGNEFYDTNQINTTGSSTSGTDDSGGTPA